MADFYEMPSARMRKVQRNQHIYFLRQRGWTLKQLGARFGITRERVRVICYGVDRLERQSLWRLETKIRVETQATLDRQYLSARQRVRLAQITADHLKRHQLAV